MNHVLKLVICLILTGMTVCKKENITEFHLNLLSFDKYYSEEVIPADYQKIYGKWKLHNISGGIHGQGYEPDFDFLEIKKIGIYGIVKNDSLFEYGKIEPGIFDENTPGYFQVKFTPDFHTKRNPRLFSQQYIDLKGTDSLNLIAPCCDMYNYHFKRIK